MMRHCLLFLIALSTTLAGRALAQSTTEPAKGLDALPEDRVLGELTNRGLDTLLERAFEVQNVPEQTREGMRALTALRELPQAENLEPAERRAVIERVVAGLEAALPAMTDPTLLMQQAATLIRSGMERDVNTLEYWGPTEHTQQALEPIARAVVQILQRAEQEAMRRSEELTARITNVDDPRLAQAEAALQMAGNAAYTRHMATYFLVLAMEADDPERARFVDEAVAGLKVYDTPDSQVQPAIRLRMAKMLMLVGKTDEAKQLLASIAENRGGEVQPEPTVAQQYEARYFTAVADLLAADIDGAQRGLEQLTRWQATNLPKDKATQDGATAATAMLQYRIHKGRAELAQTEEQRRGAQNQAVATLVDLVRRRPDLQAVVYEQLMLTMPRNPDLRGLDPLLLQALMREGEKERLKPPGEPVDAETLERAVAAGRELVRRRRDPGVDPQMVETATLLVPLLLDKLDRPVEAIEGFLDYLRAFPSSTNARLALDNALALLGRLRQDAPDDATTMRLYDRLLPIALGAPHNRTEFAYEWARRLQRLGRYKEAAEVFAIVPDDHPQKLPARFYEVVMLQQRLAEEQMPPNERQQVVWKILQRSDDVRARATASLQSGNLDASQQQMYRALLARTSLLAAEVARREMNEPQRALDLLANIEREASGLPSERDLLNGAMFARVQAYMQLGRTREATDTLVTLLRTLPGSEGASVVFNLLQRLNTDLDQARAQGDVERMRQVARDRAALSGFLVTWASKSTDADIKRSAYRYRVFDASAQHLAADLEADPQVRRQKLTDALERYEELLSAENQRQYRATSDATASAADPQVLLGIGLIQYDLQNYGDAQQKLGQLLTERQLGTPTLVMTEHEQTRIAPNEQYWEAVLKLLRSNVALAEADSSKQNLLTDSASFLKQLYIQWGKDLAGTKWSAEFEQLRQKLAPTFTPSDLSDPVAPTGNGGN